MSKKCYRFFGGLLNTQEKWLNKMSEKGYRLVRTGKLLYEFEKCETDEVTYCVEFIGEKSKESSIDYANFLEDMGYKVFFKNINLTILLERLVGGHGQNGAGVLRQTQQLLIEKS